MVRGLSVEEALGLIKENVNFHRRTENMAIGHAYGYIADRDVFAPADNPPFARSAMDGYAVRSAEVRGACRENPAVLRVTGELFAGDRAKMAWAEKSAVRIMTGGMIPAGYDAVVKQENTDYGSTSVSIYRPVSAGENYCPAGENYQKGMLLVPEGKRIDRGSIGLLAAAGIDRIDVRMNPRAAIIATGSELEQPGKPLVYGHIYNSISAMIRCSLAAVRSDVVCEQICPDDADRIAESIGCAQKEADVVITTGGVSVGKRDLMHEVLDRIGAKKLFSGVEIKPGSPTICSVSGDKVILSLSGNPYAALVNFDLYFPHIAAAMLGSGDILPAEETAIMAEDCSKNNKTRRFIRAIESGGMVRAILGSDQSSVIGNLSGCNCYIDMPAGGSAKAGERVKILRSLQN